MAGGGFHFGYYLGIYAALCESGRSPDVLLASCGGAIAAALIQKLPDDAQRKQWIGSPQMYQFWCGLKSNPNATLLGAFKGAMKRRFLGGNAKHIPDLFNDYLFEIPGQLPLPESCWGESDGGVAVAIVAGKLLYAEEEVGLLRGTRKLFSEMLFCDERSAGLLAALESPLSAAVFGNNAIAPELLTDTSMSLGDAVRASISDMFYFRCFAHSSGNYIGGVIDLFPIEVASRLANSVIMELKGGYDATYEQPAVRTVFGFDGNQRLHHVLQQHADVWVDTSDMTQVFLQQRIRQKIIWHKNSIEIVAPPTYDAYVTMINAQWQFGYQRGLDGVKSQLKASG